MTTYHSPLWLIDWDYEESDDMNQTYEDDLAELRGWLEDAHKRIAALEGERDALAAQNRARSTMYKTRDEQWRQERANAGLLAQTLSRHAPDALAAIRDQLHESTHEADKVRARVDMWRDRALRHARARDALAAQVTALEAGLRDLLPGAQWNARFDPDLRATVTRIDALLHDTTSADERAARHEPPFAGLPEVY